MIRTSVGDYFRLSTFYFPRIGQILLRIERKICVIRYIIRKICGNFLSTFDYKTNAQTILQNVCHNEYMEAENIRIL